MADTSEQGKWSLYYSLKLDQSAVTSCRMMAIRDGNKRICTFLHRLLHYSSLQTQFPTTNVHFLYVIGYHYGQNNTQDRARWQTSGYSETERTCSTVLFSPERLTLLLLTMPFANGYITLCFAVLPAAASFDSNLGDVGDPLVRRLGRYLSWPRVDPVTWRESQGRQGPAGVRWPSRLNESRSALISRAPFGYPDWGFPWFSSVVRQMPGYTMQSRVTARTPPQTWRLHLSPWKNRRSLLLSQSGFRTRTANQAQFIPPTISSVPPRR